MITFCYPGASLLTEQDQMRAKVLIGVAPLYAHCSGEFLGFEDRTVAENRVLRRFDSLFGREWRETRLNGRIMAQSRLRKPLAFACAACFELLASVFASSDALLSVFSELASLQNFTDRLRP